MKFGNGGAARLDARLTHNKQLQRTVTRRRVRGACASLHCAHAPRWTRGHAAAELRRYTALSGVRGGFW
jgi:hypothetical protein